MPMVGAIVGWVVCAASVGRDKSVLVGTWQN